MFRAGPEHGQIQRLGRAGLRSSWKPAAGHELLGGSVRRRAEHLGLHGSPGAGSGSGAQVTLDTRHQGGWGINKSHRPVCFLWGLADDLFFSELLVFFFSMQSIKVWYFNFFCFQCRKTGVFVHPEHAFPKLLLLHQPPGGAG